MKISFLTILLLAPLYSFSQKTITISGFVTETKSEESIPGVHVFVSATSQLSTTNSYGFYSMTVPARDSVSISFSHVGFEKKDIIINARADAKWNVQLQSATDLEEVVISSKKPHQVSQSPQMSLVEIPVEHIKKIPALMGEKDILKVFQLMPGVQKGSEGQAGLYVRGGGPDQNLIILDDAVVYNANHLFGFFSVFNTDAIKNVELTKGGFPARFGGRLSSVVEINMKEGSKDKLHGEGGIGLIASRLTLEGPLLKKKSSFLISARRTYIDVLAAPFLKSMGENGSGDVRPGYYFYDVNAKINYDISPKDRLYVSGYLGSDRFYIKEKSPNFNMDAGLNWGNATATLRWNHIFNDKLFANTSLIFTDFHFGTQSHFKEYSGEERVESASGMENKSHIRDLGIKADFDYFPIAAHAIRFGFQATQHKSVPSAIAVTGLQNENAERVPDKVYHALEGGAYVEDTWQPFKALMMNAGFRLSYFNAGQHTYLRPEPRFSAALKLAPDLSLKASYARMNQYVHLLSNTGLGLPTDLWVTSTDRIAPQKSSQIALGLAKDFKQPALSLTLEGFYKKMNNILSYKDGATFVGIEGNNAKDVSWEDNVTAGNGWSYGGEILAQKKAGRFSGWVGYTLSWIFWQFPDINGGKTFHPRFDRRHDVSLVGIYELTKRITLSATWVYGTGNSLTLPTSVYNNVSPSFFTAYEPTGKTTGNMIPGWQVTQYSSKGNFRAQAFHRLDVNVQFRKKKKRYERTWEVGIYNAYNRKNPFFYDVTQSAAPTGQLRQVIKKYSLFPVIPSVSYNFKF